VVASPPELLEVPELPESLPPPPQALRIKLAHRIVVTRPGSEILPNMSHLHVEISFGGKISPRTYYNFVIYKQMVNSHAKIFRLIRVIA
jgi:hypothetical protein